MLVRLLIADSISGFGDWFTYVAMSCIAASDSHAALGLALVLTAHTLPKLVMTPVAGWVADRVDRKWLLINSNLARACATLAMAACVMNDTWWALHVCHLVRMALGAFTEAASRCSLAQVTPSNQRALVNRIAGLAWNLALIAGVAGGGIVVVHVGSTAALVIDSLSFVVASTLYATLSAMPVRSNVSSAGSNEKSTAHDDGRFSLWMLSKVPVALVTGGAWFYVAQRNASAVGCSALLALRAIGAGAAPMLWSCNRTKPRRGWMESVVLTWVGAIGLVVSSSSMSMHLFALLWGAGIGCNWVASATQLQLRVPVHRFGRASAIDMSSQAIAQWCGGLFVVVLGMGCGGKTASAAQVGDVPACSATPRNSPASRPGIAAAAPATATASATASSLTLTEIAVTDDDFYRPVLYTWTTQESIDALRSSRKLLVATAKSGNSTSPLNRELEGTAMHEGSGRRIATLLTSHPDLIRRRYAWTAPYATVLGLGDHGYGNALIRIELQKDAWIGRYDPTAKSPFRFVDREGNLIDNATVAMSPSRIAALFHVRNNIPVPYREFIVCNESMVASWSVATPDIRNELDREISMLQSLRTTLGSPIDATLALSWKHAGAFDNAKYRLGLRQIDSIIERLRAWIPAGDAIQSNQ
jgi:hypothetical protein